MSWREDLKWWLEDTKQWLKDCYGFDDPVIQKQTYKSQDISSKCLIFMSPFWIIIFFLPYISENHSILLIPLIITIAGHIFSLRKQTRHRLLHFAPYWSSASLIFISLYYLSLLNIITPEAMVLSYLGISSILFIGAFYVGMR